MKGNNSRISIFFLFLFVSRKIFHLRERDKPGSFQSLSFSLEPSLCLSDFHEQPSGSGSSYRLFFSGDIWSFLYLSLSCHFLVLLFLSSRWEAKRDSWSLSWNNYISLLLSSDRSLAERIREVNCLQPPLSKRPIRVGFFFLPFIPIFLSSPRCIKQQDRW